jgi:hypothetical protein
MTGTLHGLFHRLAHSPAFPASQRKFCGEPTVLSDAGVAFRQEGVLPLNAHRSRIMHSGQLGVLALQV